MKLKDLKQGMVCELRNGNPFAVLDTNAGRKFYNDRSNAIFTLSDDYKDDLTHEYQKDYDIIKVTYGNDVIYERQERSDDFLKLLWSVLLDEKCKIILTGHEERQFVEEYLVRDISSEYRVQITEFLETLMRKENEKWLS